MTADAGMVSVNREDLALIDRALRSLPMQAFRTEATRRLRAQAIDAVRRAVLDAPSEPPEPTTEQIEAWRDEHCWIPSVDVCGHCGDSECGGVGCIASLDDASEDDYEAMNNLHDLLRFGRAWRLMQELRGEGADRMLALTMAEDAIAAAGYNHPEEVSR